MALPAILIEMDFTTALEKLETSDVYLDWHEHHSAAYLTHFFAEIDEQFKLGSWQIGFYEEDNDRLSTFLVDGVIELEPQAEAFKKEKTIRAIEIDAIKVSAQNAIDSVLVLQKNKYPQHLVLKGFLILQHAENATIWNVTFLTRTFAALNVRLDSVSGKVIRDELITLFDLRQK